MPCPVTVSASCSSSSRRRAPAHTAIMCASVWDRNAQDEPFPQRQFPSFKFNLKGKKKSEFVLGIIPFKNPTEAIIEKKKSGLEVKSELGAAGCFWSRCLCLLKQKGSVLCYKGVTQSGPSKYVGVNLCSQGDMNCFILNASASWKGH